MRCARLGLAAVVGAAACVPDPGPSPSIITAPRILAVRSDPAEAKPGTDVAYQVLAVSSSGPISSPGLTWGFCLTPKPLTENNVVTPDCLQDDRIQPIAADPYTANAKASIPSEACRLFGPDAPPEVPGQPPLRPRDADVTGGYYQPLRVTLDPAVVAFGLQRIVCNLAGASADLTQEFHARYHENQNPTLLSVALSVDGAPRTSGMLPASGHVHLSAQLGPASAETFPLLDPVSKTLVDQRESLRLSWFASSGRFEHDRTGLGESEQAALIDNDWEAPAEPGPVYFWLVLRDSRGGVDYASLSAVVTIP